MAILDDRLTRYLGRVTVSRGEHNHSEDCQDKSRTNPEGTTIVTHSNCPGNLVLETGCTAQQ